MFKLILSVLVILTVSTLGAGSGSAQHLYANQIGLFMTADAMGATHTNSTNVPVNVYLVLINPSRPDGTLFSGITAFDCQLNFNPVGGIFLTGNALNGEGFNIGDTASIDQGFLEFIVGFSAEVPVEPDGSLLLATLQFINTNLASVYVTMSPASIPSIPGTIGFLPANPPLVEMFPASGGFGNPIFAFNGEAVPIEEESFGSVKALYR